MFTKAKKKTFLILLLAILVVGVGGYLTFSCIAR